MRRHEAIRVARYEPGVPSARISCQLPSFHWYGRLTLTISPSLGPHAGYRARALQRTLDGFFRQTRRSRPRRRCSPPGRRLHAGAVSTCAYRYLRYDNALLLQITRQLAVRAEIRRPLAADHEDQSGDLHRTTRTVSSFTQCCQYADKWSNDLPAYDGSVKISDSGHSRIENDLA